MLLYFSCTAKLIRRTNIKNKSALHKSISNSFSEFLFFVVVLQQLHKIHSVMFFSITTTTRSFQINRNPKDIPSILTPPHDNSRQHLQSTRLISVDIRCLTPLIRDLSHKLVYTHRNIWLTEEGRNKSTIHLCICVRE